VAMVWWQMAWTNAAVMGSGRDASAGRRRAPKWPGYSQTIHYEITAAGRIPTSGTARRAAVSDHLPGHINTLFRTQPPVSVDTGARGSPFNRRKPAADTTESAGQAGIRLCCADSGGRALTCAAPVTWRPLSHAMLSVLVTHRAGSDMAPLPPGWRGDLTDTEQLFWDA
jgi:hypothetical protein